jgi:hypothetical protein
MGERAQWRLDPQGCTSPGEGPGTVGFTSTSSGRRPGRRLQLGDARRAVQRWALNAHKQPGRMLPTGARRPRRLRAVRSTSKVSTPARATSELGDIE